MDADRENCHPEAAAVLPAGNPLGRECPNLKVRTWTRRGNIHPKINFDVVRASGCVTPSGDVKLQLRCFFRDADNPGAVVQAFVALPGKAIGHVYGGVPGRRGTYRDVTVTIPSSKIPPGVTPVYLIGNWITLARKAISIYERTRAGHRVHFAMLTKR